MQNYQSTLYFKVFSIKKFPHSSSRVKQIVTTALGKNYLKCKNVAHASACAKSYRIFKTQTKRKIVSFRQSKPAFGSVRAKHFLPKTPVFI